MATPTVKEQIIDELDRLTPSQQAHLLGVARQLQRTPLPPGTPGEVLIEHMDRFTFAPGALDEMMRAIEEDCERIDWDGWQ